MGIHSKGRPRARGLAAGAAALLLALAVALSSIAQALAPAAAYAAGASMTVTSTEDGSGYFGGMRVHFAHATQGTGGAAYCAQGYMRSPVAGDTFANAGWPGIPELDYVLYHGYDGQVVTSVHGLTGNEARAATVAAVWLAIAEQRPDILKANDAAYHGNQMYYERWQGITNPAVKNAAWELYQEGLAYKAAGAGGPEAGCTTLWTTGKAATQYMVTAEKSVSVTFTKTSAKASISDGNAEYSVAGAEYDIFRSADNSKVAHIVTGADGTATYQLRPNDYYYAVETKAPKGFKLNTARQEFQTGNRDGSEKLVDDPGRVTFTVKKKDSETLGEAQGGATLEGAEYELTDANGKVHNERTDADGYIRFKDIPLGRITVRETRAPRGYKLDSSVHEYAVTSTTHTTQITDSGLVELTPEDDFKEDVVRGGAAVSKRDADTGSKVNSGDASFEGVEVSVVSDNDGPVMVDGRKVGRGGVAATIVLDRDGNGSTAADALPYGSYHMVETKGNASYRVNGDWRHDFKIRSDGQIERADGSSSVPDTPVSGDVEVRKFDADSMATSPAGAASFKGAEFLITNRSAGPVKVAGTLYQPGEVVATIIAGKEGVAKTEGGALPFGTYEIRETRAPKGYKLNSEWSRTFQIRSDGQVVSFAAAPGVRAMAGGTADSGVAEAVKRGDIRFNKVAGVSQDRLARVAFLVTSGTTGEAHVIVTDENGMYDSSASWNPHTTYTDDEGQTHAANANDALLSADGKSITDSSRLDPLSGTWFDGYAPGTARAQADDSLGALPYDTYTVQELRCDANQGFQLVRVKVSVTRDGVDLDAGTVTDTVPGLESKLADASGNQELEASRSLALTDTVKVTDVAKGRSYKLVMKLWDATAGAFLKAADGSDLEVSTSFTPAGPNHTVRQRAEIDASGLTGHTVVAYEYLYDDAGTLLAEHEDAADLDQTVSFAAINTTATDGDGGKDVPADALATIHDKVDYEGLRAGSEYVLKATAHVVSADGTDEGETRGEDGRAASATKTFVAEAADGSATVDLKVDTTGLKGKRVVVFEVLTRSERTVATHEDLSDEGQTVRVPEISTKAEGEDGTKTARAAEDSEFTDTVSYKGLTPGREYALSATLADPDTGKALTDASGNPYAAAATFTPSASDGETKVSFKIDARALAGRTATVFEVLSRDGVAYASHEDATDKGQQVDFPKIRTAATDSGTGLHEVPAASEVKVTDAVSYKGLVPGREYTVTGTLMDKGTGKPATRADGSEITAARTFKPEKADGAVELEFTFDATGLAGKSLVAFEDVSSEGRSWAVHADLSDEDQTVHVPKIGTTLTAANGLHESQAGEDGELTLTDTVAYENLIPGHEYEVAGTLHVKGDKDGKATDAGALKGADGKDVTAKASFKAEKASGTVDVKFEFDASDLAGRDLVAFEELRAEGHVIATHEDIGDGGQTVRVADIGTKAEDAPDHDKSVELRDGTATIVDSVSYKGLTPGRAYELQADLKVKPADGGKDGCESAPMPELAADQLASLAREVGLPESVELLANGRVRFTPDAADGEVGVPIRASIDALAGRNLVAFEKLTADGVEVASHADIDDEGQTVSVPKIGTTLTAPDGGHAAIAGGTTTLTDTVSYTGLTPGVEYTVEGVLHLAPGKGGKGAEGAEGNGVEAEAATLEQADEAGEAPADTVLKGDDGQPVKGRATFTPDKASGTVKVSFAVDSSKLAGRKVVAFERAYRDGGKTLVATHEDISDGSQTVAFTAPLPQTGAMGVAGAVAAAAIIAGGIAATMRERRSGGEGDGEPGDAE